MVTGANRLFALSILARLPVAMLSIGLLVHTQQATGSYAAAGLVAGALALAQGIGGPLLGRAVDRRGQTLVLATSALACAGALVASAVLPSGAPVAIRVSLAVAAGAALPPVGACLRTLLAMLVDKDGLRGAYATDAAASELCWIGGPPIVLGVGAAVSTGAALAVAGVLLGLSTVAFALTRPSRAWRPAVRAGDARGALKAPGVRTLVAVLAAVGCVFGGVEVAVAAAAQQLGTGGSAGPLLGLWGIGSLIGGVAAARLGGGARGAGGLTVLLLALGALHAALALAGSPLLLGALLLLAGATIAPTYATAYAMVDAVAPSGTATEAFAWLATAIAVGSAAGSAAGGAVIDAAGPQVTFALAGLAAGLAAAITLSRARTLPGVVSSIQEAHA